MEAKTSMDMPLRNGKEVKNQEIKDCIIFYKEI